MRRKYVVQRVEGYDGIEFLADSPVGRRIYGPGEVIELDDQIHNVARLIDLTQITAFEVAEAAEVEATGKE